LSFQDEHQGEGKKNAWERLSDKKSCIANRKERQNQQNTLPQTEGEFEEKKAEKGMTNVKTVKATERFVGEKN